MHIITTTKCFVLLLLASCLLDLSDDGVDLADAPGVDGPALLLAGLSADVGGNVVKDGGEGDVDNVSLAEGGGNGELVLLENVFIVTLLPACYLRVCHNWVRGFRVFLLTRRKKK